MSYQLAKVERELAYQRYNYASAALDRASIKMRLAEIQDQHEPLHELTGGDRDMREKILAAAFYVVVGCFPDSK